MVASGIMMALIAGFVSASADVRQRMGLHTEAQQGVRALLELITQELRQAGACLPEGGQFIALDGTEGGAIDRLTVRIGRTDPTTLICLIVASTQTANAGESTILVADSTGFANGSWIYITPNGATGDFYTVIATTATSLTLDAPLGVTHPAGSGIYAIDERVYAVDTTSYSSPVLTVAMDGSSAQPLVDGVETFNIQYQLAPCPPCTAVNLPADDSEWRDVRSLMISATIRSEHVDTDGNLAYESGQVHVRPRNLL